MRVFSFEDFISTGGQRDLVGISTSSYYERISWVYSCVNRIGMTASSAPLAIYKKASSKDSSQEEKNRVTDPNHPIRTLFEPPDHPLIVSFSDLLYRTFIHLSIDGLLYWVTGYENLEGKKETVPQRIKLRSKSQLRPLLVEVRGSTAKRLVGWEEVSPVGGGDSIKYAVNDVIPIRYYDPNNPLGGLTPLKAARLSLEQEMNIAGWNASFFKSGMKTPLLIQNESGMMTAEQKREIRSEVINYFSGIEGGHGALLLGKGYTVTPLALGSKDVDFLNGKKLNREEILSIFGVPPALVGIFEYSNYSNVREQIRIFWEQTLLPRLTMILELIQINIINRHFPDYLLAWDTSRIAGLQVDPVSGAEAVKNYIEAGFHPNKIADLLGMPKLRVEKRSDWKDPNAVVTPPASNNSNSNNTNSNNEKPPKESNENATDTGKAHVFNYTKPLCKQSESLQVLLKEFYSRLPTGFAVEKSETWTNLFKDLCSSKIDYVVKQAKKECGQSLGLSVDQLESDNNVRFFLEKYNECLLETLLLDAAKSNEFKKQLFYKTDFISKYLVFCWFHLSCYCVYRTLGFKSQAWFDDKNKVLFKIDHENLLYLGLQKAFTSDKGLFSVKLSPLE